MSDGDEHDNEPPVTYLRNEAEDDPDGQVEREEGRLVAVVVIMRSAHQIMHHPPERESFVIVGGCEGG